MKPVLDVRTSSDVGEDANWASVREELVRGLQAERHTRKIPTVVLYDEKGLKIYDKITTDAAECYVGGTQARSMLAGCRSETDAVAVVRC